MSDTPRQYLRFVLVDRVLHLLLLLSFTILGLTGIPQKYADAGLSVAVIQALGGIEQTRTIHHTAAVVLIIISIIHLVEAGYNIYVKRVPLDMLPGLKDFTDFLDATRYNLGLSDQHPRYGRYNWIEKLEYWAVVWGTALMTVTGYVLWNPIVTTRFLPGEVVPAAKIAHGLEAVLAILAILTWHAYFVHMAKFNKSMFTGYLSEDEMHEEHQVELEQRLTGAVRQPPDDQTRWRRLLIYTPIAAVFVVVSLVGTWWWLSMENTAITTVPRIAAEEKVYQPVPLEQLDLASERPVVPTPLTVLGASTGETPAPPPAITHPVDESRSQCSLCHDPNGLIRPAPLDHVGRADDQCQTCHQEGSP